MARIDVIMPQMGESITEGTMSRWIKQVGDAVKRDEPIFEISTDKVDAEIPAPNAGVLVEVLVTEGQTVSVGTVVARIDTEVHRDFERFVKLRRSEFANGLQRFVNAVQLERVNLALEGLLLLGQLCHRFSPPSLRGPSNGRCLR